MRGLDSGPDDPRGARARLGRSRRVVVKVGSGVLSAGGGGLHAPTLRRLALELSEAKRGNRELLLVSSGAILAGRERLALSAGAKTSTPLKQAAAAVGQSRLMRAWEAAFARRGEVVAQVLLTRDDIRHRERYLNARNTLSSLLRLAALPIINENDTVAVDEIRFGDNDVLSALVAVAAEADLLVLLTDQDGLFTADPRRDSAARLIPEVGLEAPRPRAGRPGPSGSGGMESKSRAARLAAEAGIPAVIANGTRPGSLRAILGGEPIGTLFVPAAKPGQGRRRWLAYAAQPKGRIHVDAGARDALVSGSRSLLPSGVRAFSQDFEPGDVVSLVADGVEFARGLTNFGSRELDRIKGLKTSEVPAALGRRAAGEVVHRDNLAVLAAPPALPQFPSRAGDGRPPGSTPPPRSNAAPEVRRGARPPGSAAPRDPHGPAS